MQKNKYILKRKILLIAFTLMLVFSLATITFSWYRNYVEVTGPEITTGHINVNMSTYYVNNNVIAEETNTTINEETHGTVLLDSDIETFLPDGKTHLYYFFENPGNTNSIDLEVLLSMDIEGLYTDYDVSRIGGVNITLDNETADFKDWVTKRYPTNPTFSEARFESYIKDSNVNHTGGDTRNFLELENAIISGSVKKNDILCIRVTVSLNEAFTVSHLNKQYPLRMSLCVAQEGGLPGMEKITTFYASTLSSLNAALNLYKPNDKIYITGDIDYIGDLIINKPVEIYVQDASLNVYGNLMFSYSYPGAFMLNTVQAGKICVYRINNAGGDFEIDIPNASIELIGRNNSVNGNADIYVQRNMTVTASENIGIVFTGSRICETAGEEVFLDTLNDIQLGEHTRVEVGSRTNIGNLHSESSIVKIRNNGTINEINLELLQHDTTYETSPNIFIDNYSSIQAIKLPSWSRKFVMTETEDPSTGEPVQDYTGNTRIVSNTGASFGSITCSGDFKYDGSKDPAKDDVEYVRMNLFVETVNGNKNDIIVHYTITEIPELVAAGTDNTLAGIFNYYSSNAGGNIINAVTDITSLKVICYSGSFLSTNDYTFIRKMTNLKYIDLSEAVSVNYTVPDNALRGLTKLTNAILSETDTKWSNYIFNTTAVTEVYIPTNVTSLTSENSLNNIKYLHTNTYVIDIVVSWGKKANNYLFVPDKTTLNAYAAKSVTAYQLFLEATRYSGTLGDYFFRINENNKTIELATIVQNANDNKTFDYEKLISTDYKLNFDTVFVNDQYYKLTSIDNHALRERTFNNFGGNNLDFSFGDALTNIGDYAFYKCNFNNNYGYTNFIFGESLTNIGTYAFYQCNFNNINNNNNSYINFIFGEKLENIASYAFNSAKGVETIVFEGATVIGEHAFVNFSVLKSVKAEYVTYIGTYAFNGASTLFYFYAPSLTDYGNYFIANTSTLKYVEVGMVANATRILFSGSCSTIVLHTDNTPDPSTFTSKINLGGSFNTLIVNEKYYEVWRNSYYHSNANTDRTEDILSIPCSAKDLIRVEGEWYPCYLYYRKGNNEVVLLKSVLDEIDGNDKDFVVPTVSKIDHSLIYENDNPNAYSLVEVGATAYKYTKIKNVNILTFLDTVKTIGVKAFKANATPRPGESKEYGYLELNKVTHIGEFAFANNTMSSINGQDVYFCGADGFANCSYTCVAMLPNIMETTGEIFTNHTNLKLIIIGPLEMNGTAYADNGIIYSTLNIGLILLNATNVTKTPNPLMYAVGSTLYWFRSSDTPVIYLGSNSTNAADTVINSFDDLYFADFYKHSVTINDKVYEYDIPSYVYYQKDGQLCLGYNMAPITTENYLVPSEIFITDETVNVLGEEVVKYTTTKPANYDESNERYIATVIGTGALKHKSIPANCNVKLGSGFLSMGQYSFQNKEVNSLDVSNVTIIEGYAINNAKMYQFIGNHVEVLRSHSMRNISYLEVINLPSIITIEYNAFRGNPLKEIILGESLVNFARGAFEELKSLEYIYIYSTNNLAGGQGFLNCTNIDKVIVYVPESRLSYYQSSAIFTGITKTNIFSFEKNYVDEETGLSYLLTDLGDNKAKIEKVVGLSNGVDINRLEIPSEFSIIEKDGDTIISQQDFITTELSVEFFNSFKNILFVEELVLPQYLEKIDGANEALVGCGITTISISTENPKFKSENGVLYSKDMSILVLYPAGKQNYEFTLPSQVNTILDYAFANNIYITKVTCPNKVTILNGAFKGCSSLREVIFESTIPSTFIGKNIFDSSLDSLVLYVPTDTLNDYISNIIFDLDIANLLQERSNG